MKHSEVQMKKVIKDPTFNVYSKGGNVENLNKPIDKEKLADLEKMEFDVEQNIIDALKDEFNKQKEYKNFLDFLKSKDKEFFKRLELKDGARVISLSDYRKSKEPKVKEINLASLFDHAKTIASLTEAERSVVEDLLRRSLGKDK